MLEVTMEWEGLDAAFAALEQQCTDIVRGIAIEAWNYVLSQTPQFFGDAVASWTFTTVSPSFVDRSNLVDHADPLLDEPDPNDPKGFKYQYDPDTIKRKGNSVAIEIANTFSAMAPYTFRLGQEIWFANGRPYSQALEDGTINLRSVNRPGHMVSRALDHIQTAYGDQVSPRSVQRLTELKVG
jgi:hypothetical protein